MHRTSALFYTCPHRKGKAIFIICKQIEENYTPFALQS